MHRVLLTLFLFFISGKNSIACKLKTPFAKASIRKSCVSLKSQANALTFIFLSGIVFSQSLIVAYNFVNSTAQDLSFSEGLITPTGFAVGVPEQGETERAVPVTASVLEGPSEESGDVASISEPADDRQQPTSDERVETPAPEEGAPDAADSEEAEPPVDVEEIIIPPEENPPSENSDGISDDSTHCEEENENSGAASPVLPEQPDETQDSDVSTPDLAEPPTENNSSDDDVPDVTTPVLEEATLEASLVFPSDIKRGDTFTLVVSLTNTGSAPANNIVVELEMPDGASATESSKSINSLAAGEFSEVDVTIQLSYEAQLGENEIKVRVSYE